MVKALCGGLIRNPSIDVTMSLRSFAEGVAISLGGQVALLEKIVIKGMTFARTRGMTLGPKDHPLGADPRYSFRDVPKPALPSFMRPLSQIMERARVRVFPLHVPLRPLSRSFCLGGLSFMRLGVVCPGLQKQGMHMRMQALEWSSARSRGFLNHLVGRQLDGCA